MDFRVHNSWEPIDFDGLKLMLRPSPARIQKLVRKDLDSVRQPGHERESKYQGEKESSASFDSYVVVDLETTGLYLLKTKL